MSREALLPELAQERIVPRFDEDIAGASTDESTYFKDAAGAYDLGAHIAVQLTEETSGYAQELVETLTGLTCSRRNISEPIEAAAEIAIRRRIRQLLVLLKGNDVWVYSTVVIRRLPERHTIAPADEPCTHQFRMVVAFGPPGEYGDTSMPRANRPWAALRSARVEFRESRAGKLNACPDRRSRALRAAKAIHDTVIGALKKATSGRAPPDPVLVERQAAAAMEEFNALAALRGLRR